MACEYTMVVSILASLETQQAKNPSAMWEPQETWVQSLGREDALEEGMGTHSSVLAWRTPRTEEPDEHSLWGLRVRHA